MSKFRRYTELLNSGRDLLPDEAADLFLALVGSDRTDAITSVLDAWSQKGATAIELSVCASILRNNAFKPEIRTDSLLDIVGTGGSSAKIFNISTAAAFVAAGAGVPVAKHGNRAATSNTGSADALSNLGINVAVEPARVGGILDEIGICFMFAPAFHDLKPELAVARKAFGKPSIFNQLGPLANPALAPFQLIGVWNDTLLPTMAGAVLRLGTGKTWIVRGSDGLDEITLTGTTRVCEIADEQIREFEVVPEDFGFKSRSIDAYRNMTPAKSAAIIGSILDGSERGSAAEEIVLLNAAAAIYVSGGAPDYAIASEMAKASVRDGLAVNKLNQLRGRTRI